MKWPFCLVLLLSACSARPDPTHARERCAAVHERYIEMWTVCGLGPAEAEARYLAIPGNPPDCDAVGEVVVGREADVDQCLLHLGELETACPEATSDGFAPTAECLELFR